MKQQKPGLAIKPLNTYSFKGYKRLIFQLLVAFVFISSCKNDLEKIHLLSNDTVIPDLSAENIYIYRSDSGKLVVKVFAPKIKKFASVEEPFTEFPEGLELYFLDSIENTKTSIKAKYAIQYHEQNLYFARDSVVVKDEKTGDWLRSDEMHWDPQTEKIYSDKFTTISQNGKLLYALEGFISNQDFTEKTLRKTTGDLNWENE